MGLNNSSGIHEKNLILREQLEELRSLFTQHKTLRQLSLNTRAAATLLCDAEERINKLPLDIAYMPLEQARNLTIAQNKLKVANKVLIGELGNFELNLKALVFPEEILLLQTFEKLKQFCESCGITKFRKIATFLNQLPVLSLLRRVRNAVAHDKRLNLPDDHRELRGTWQEKKEKSGFHASFAGPAIEAAKKHGILTLHDNGEAVFSLRPDENGDWNENDLFLFILCQGPHLYELVLQKVKEGKLEQMMISRG